MCLNRVMEEWIIQGRGGYQVHVTAEQLLQTQFQREIGIGVGARREISNGHEYVQVAARRVETLSQFGLAQIELLHVVPPAQRPQGYQPRFVDRPGACRNLIHAQQMAVIPKRDRERLLEALEMVATEPARRFSFVTEMVGQPGVWRLRKGNWRAAFRWREADVVVDRVGNRRDAYR